MCPPLYFRSGAEERERALSQWRGLYRLLRDELSVDVDLLEPRPDLPDLAHVGNGGSLVGDTFCVGRAVAASGHAESPPLENFFLVRGYNIEYLSTDASFDGNQDLVGCGTILFSGSHSRDGQRVRVNMSASCTVAVMGLEFADGWAGPLTTCLCPVSEAEALFCPTAFTDEARRTLASRIPKLVPVDEKERDAGLFNSLIVGRDVVVAEGCSMVRPNLESLGLTVHELTLDVFSAAGGPRSLALHLD